jgi:predicted RND superfamily exporter protein
MEFDRMRTAAAFLGLVVVGVGGLAASGVMETSTVLMMVAPTTLVYGLLCLGIGVKHGEYRARAG